MVNNNDFASGLLSGFMNTYVPIAKMGLEREQAAQLAAYRQAQLDQMKFEQGRQQKSDWQNDYDKGMKQLANNYLAGVLTGKNPSLPDSSVLGYMDPSVLAAIQQKDQDRAMTGAFMKAVGGSLPGSPTAPSYSGGTASPKPTSSLPENLDFSGAATAAGAPELASFLPSVVKAESGGNPNAQATTSSAYGLGQFTSGTRQAILNKYGVDAWSKDPNEQLTALAYLAKDNRDGLASSMGVTPDQITPQQIYMANFLGQGGANTFLTGMQRDPNTPAVALVSPEAARANAGIFFKSDKTPRTAQEVFDLMGSKVAPVQLAQAGGQTMTDASGNPVQPAQPMQPQAPTTSRQDLVGMANRIMPFASAPGKVGEMAKNTLSAIKTVQELNDPSKPVNAFVSQYGRQPNWDDPQDVGRVKNIAQAMSTNSVNVNIPPEQEAAAKEAGKTFITSMTSLKNEANAASQTLRGLNDFNALAPDATGSLAKAKILAAGVLQSIGVDPKTIPALAKAPDLQTMQTVINQSLLPTIQNTTAFHTNFSDADRNFLMAGFQNIANIPEANAKIADILRRNSTDKIAQYKHMSKATNWQSFNDLNAQWLDQKAQEETQRQAELTAKGQSQAQTQQPQSNFPEAKQAPDGNWYVPDPNRPGKYLRVESEGAQ